MTLQSSSLTNHGGPDISINVIASDHHLKRYSKSRLNRDMSTYPTL